MSELQWAHGTESRRSFHYDDGIRTANHEARALARSGEPEGSLVLTESRVIGHGRFGRPVKVPAGDRLVFSAVLRPPRDAAGPDTLTALAAAAVAEAIETVVPVEVLALPGGRLFVGGRRVGGVMVEKVGGNDSESFLVGVSVNVSTPADELPVVIRPEVTSLEATTGHRVHRGDLLAQVLVALHEALRSLADTSIQATLTAA